MSKPPPYTRSTGILELCMEISKLVDRHERTGIPRAPNLRRINRIRTVRGSVAIEGNTLTEEQISTLLDGKHIIAPGREVREVNNALTAYDRAPQWNPHSEADLLNAHAVLMEALLDVPGSYRSVSVGVDGRIAPPVTHVSGLMADLLAWLASSNEHPLITSCVFHYEFEFIHPFEDGNGRMGRLWQNLILSRWKSLFVDVPVESLVHKHQSDYYQALRDSTTAGESTPFIEFMLEMIVKALPALQVSEALPDQAARLFKVLRKTNQTPKTAAQLMGTLGLSHRTSFRQNYLRPALDAKLIEMTRPESPTAKNQQYRLTELGRQRRK